MKNLFEMFDLQLFATQTTLLNSQGNDLSPENKTYYDKRLIDYAEPELVHDQFGQKRPIPKRGGKTIEFRKFSPLDKALTPITEGVTPSGNKLNVTALTATVNQYGDYIEVSDVIDMTAIDPVMEETVSLLGSQAGRTLDTITRDVLAGGTNVLFAGSASAREAIATTDLISVDNIFKAAAILKGMNAKKIGGGYVAIIHPYVSHDLMIASKANGTWTDIQKYANPEAIFNGEIGKIGGVRFVENTEAKIFYGDDLASDSRTLTVNNASGITASKTIAFDSGTVAASALVGRYVIIGSTKTKVTANTTTQLTVEDDITCDDNTVIYPGEGGAGGSAVFSTLVLGADAYGVTEITGGGLETIIKSFGSGQDPLNQRATAGWKATKTAERLIEEYMLRIESSSTMASIITKAN